MKLRPSFLAFIAVGLLALCASVRAQADAALPTLYICGDSTAAPSKPPLQGWGVVVGELFDAAKIHVENRALGGRSARTFIEEKRWSAVKEKLHKGDFVFLQFGHNDTRGPLTANRYDLPGLGNEVEEGTGIRTFGFYMRQMIDEGVASGATVIVLSPVPRNKWAGGKIVRGEENHGEWAAALAKEKGVAFLDANALIADIYDPIGQTRIKALYFPQDNTHPNDNGARLNAATIAHGLITLQSPLAALLKPTAATTTAELIAGVPKAAAEVKLTVNLKSVFPAVDATNIPPDAPLRITFAAPPKLGSGKIQVIETGSNTTVDTIDASAPLATKTISGITNFSYHTVLIAGSDAVITLKPGALAYGKSYTVTIDAGVFKDGADTYGEATLRFATKAAPPAAGTAKLTVAADGTGDFCTVQGAFDFIPEGNTTPTTVYVGKGTYNEILVLREKNAVTLLGEDRKQTVIAYPNNDRFNNKAGGNPFAIGASSPAASGVDGAIYRRGVFLAHRTTDLTVANLAIRNTTPQGGSQAEAIIFNGTTEAHTTIRDVDLYSFQDTVQINGQAYVTGCYVEGDVDFLWGTGPCFFENCTARSMRSGAYYTQIRNPATNRGYVFLRCTFDGAPGITGTYLTRIAPSRFFASEVVLLDCTMTNAVGDVAWQLQGAPAAPKAASADAPPPAAPDTSKLHFWEYNSHHADGSPVDVSKRLGTSRQLKQPDDAAAIRDYSDPAFVLGGWNPKGK